MNAVSGPPLPYGKMVAKAWVCALLISAIEYLVQDAIASHALVLELSIAP